MKGWNIFAKMQGYEVLCNSAEQPGYAELNCKTPMRSPRCKVTRNCKVLPRGKDSTFPMAQQSLLSPTAVA